MVGIRQRRFEIIGDTEKFQRRANIRYLWIVWFCIRFNAKNESKVHDIIVGNTFEGEVTLVECTEIYATASHFYDIDDSETYTRYIVRRAVKGRHYESKSHILLPKLTVEFTNLQAWLGYQPLNLHINR